MLAWPGPGARAKNPYTWLLYTRLAEMGVRVRDFTMARALGGGYDILHIHWPEKALATGGRLRRFAGGAAGLAVLEAARLRGARVVWTTHNAKPHEAGDTALERWYWKGVLGAVDGLIHPSAASQSAVEHAYPALRALPHAVVRLGHFRGSYPDGVSRQEARAGFGIPESAAVVAFLGLVRPYKNVPRLVAAVRALPAERQAVLLVGGQPLTAGLAEEIEAAAAGDPRIRLTLSHVPDEDVQRFMRAADLVVLPFTDITNSGSALLALSFDRPVLVPSLGAMGELQELVGADWVSTYEGDLTPTVLDDALRWARGVAPGRVPDLSPLDWSAIAEGTLRFYRAVLRGNTVSAEGSSPKA